MTKIRRFLAALVAALLLLACGAQAEETPRVHRRALLIGRSSVVRGPSLWSTSALPSVRYELPGMLKAFRKSRFDGFGINTSALLNAPRSAVRNAIARKFAKATAGDVSYLYLTCHALARDGEVYMQPCTGAAISASQLKSWLDPIPGTKVLIVNACQSGALIGKNTDGDIAGALVRCFAASSAKSADFTGGGYLVLCSAKGSESAYAFRKEDIFAWAMSSGIGWNYVEREKSWIADVSGDGVITFGELYAATRDGVTSIMNDLNMTEIQTVCAWPEISDVPVFAGGL